MKEIIKKCLAFFSQQSCCHPQNSNLDCACSKCWQKEFNDHAIPDTYQCLKKLSYYALSYGTACTSELYHLFSSSQLLEKYSNVGISALSLGCGFGTDLIAIKQYFSDNNLSISLRYHGIDNSPLWEKIRNKYSGATYVSNDIFDEFEKVCLSHYNLIFLNRFLSTLKKNGRSDSFFSKFLPKITKEFPSGAFLVFNDINHVDMGRDEFLNKLSSVFSSSEYFYFPVESKTYRGVEFGGFSKLPSTKVLPQFSENSPYAPQTVQKIMFAVCRK